MWDPEDNYIAGCFEDGLVRIYNPYTGNMLKQLGCRTSGMKLPVTCAKWRPEPESIQRTKHIITSGNVEGTIYQHHARSGDNVRRKQFEEEIQFFCMDYNADGTNFAVGSNDSKIRVFDEETFEVAETMMPSDGEIVGHSNNIYCVKFVNDSTLVSGGWDDHVYLWDIRAKSVMRSWYGPHVCGDSIEVVGDRLIVGSMHPET
jgi:WD40 repeat protein